MAKSNNKTHNTTILLNRMGKEPKEKRQISSLGNINSSFVDDFVMNDQVISIKEEKGVVI